MSLQNRTDPSVRSIHPIVAEFGLVTAILVGLYLWHRLVRSTLSAAFGPPPMFGGVLVDGLVSGGLLLAGLVLFAGAYGTVRDIEPGPVLPSRVDLPTVGLAVAVPVAFVGLTKLVGVLTGVRYNSLTKASVAADAPVLPVVLLAGLGVLVGVPVLVVVCQLLVQGSFERVVGGDGAVVLTTLVAGFVMVSDTGGLTTVPDRGKLAGAVLFALLLGLALYARERVERDRLRYLGYAPVLVLAAVVVLSGVAGIDSVAAGLFAATQLAALGVAAYAYDRTGSLLAPALAYASLLLADRAVVFLFEAGMQSW